MKSSALALGVLGLLGSFLAWSLVAAEPPAARGIAVEPVLNAAPGGNAGLFVGINQFSEDRTLRALDFAVNDAVSQAYLFVVELRLVPPAHCHLALAGEPGTPQIQAQLAALEQRGVQRDNPIKTGILRALSSVTAQGASRDDLVIVSFSTHGFEDNGVVYVMPADGLRSDLGETALKLPSVEQRLGQSQAGKRLLLVDACRERAVKDGRGEGDGMSSAFRAALAAVEGQAVLAACDAGQTSFENPRLGYGVFTYHLLEGLHGRAVADKRGYITLGSVSDYLAEAVSGWLGQNVPELERGKLPRPWFKGPTELRQMPLAVSLAVKSEAAKAREQTRVRIEKLTKLFLDRQITTEQLAQGQRVLEGEETALDEEDQQRRKIYLDVAEGGLKPEYLQGALDRVETREQRVARLEREARAAKMNALLAKARANANHEHAKVALAALEELLNLEPQHAEALSLRKKIIRYYGAKPGDTLMLDLGGDVKLELVYIPPGEFMMGSTAAEREWAAGPEGQGKPEWLKDEGETPRRTRIRDGFWLGRTEVTVGQWKRFVEDTSYRTDAEKSGQAWCFDWDTNQWGVVKGKSWRDPNYGFEVRDDHPVACISWNDATAFCGWLGKRARAADLIPADLPCRLPTEAEWEYACRGGREGTKFWWGDSVEDGKGRLNVASADGLGNTLSNRMWNVRFPWSDGYAWVAPVDSYGEGGRNGFGLADMLGNVWEWCLDGWNGSGAQEDCYTAETTWRVLRGGSFFSVPGYARCASRSQAAPPANAVANGGFRECVGVGR